MSGDRRQYIELEEYIKQGEPEQAEKSKIWQTAIGLQDVLRHRRTCLRRQRSEREQSNEERLRCRKKA